MIAGLARFCNGDVGRAEDLAQDALVSALETWPREGVPRNPGAWLMTTAKNRQIDLARRARVFQVKVEELGRELPVAAPEPDPEAIDDDVLSLVFTTCHPVLSQESQVALTLRMVGGLKTEEIARAFLTSDSTIGQRVSRAKRTLAESEVPFEVPPPEQRLERMAAVLGVIYLIFNEGYSATTGEEWVRLDLCDDAVRLGRMMQQLMPQEAEVHGLAALMELQASRFPTRITADGSAIPLEKQNRQFWDRLAIDRGLKAIERAKAAPTRSGSYTLQAEIAACHATPRHAEDTDWFRIAALYRDLSNLTGSPIVELNRAVAVGRASGPEAGLRVLDSIADDPALANYHLLPIVQGDLLEKAGRVAEAAEEFDRAAGMTRNEREREALIRRRNALRTNAET
ncbi:MAG: RNA polymerase sigma factor [Solirubrobacterales bacterium]